MRYDQNSLTPSSAIPPTTKIAVGSNIEVIDTPEVASTINGSGRISSRAIRPPARYDDFIRHDTRVRDGL